MGKSEITAEQVRKLHEVQLGLAVLVKSICEANNLKYFLLAGTLLGAVRHAGFIPWDDDMDLAMPREDYEKFFVAWQTASTDGFFLQTRKSDANFVLPFAKVRKEGTLLVERGFEAVQYHQGIAIDIFPIDTVPQSALSRAFHRFGTYALKRALLVRVGYVIDTERSHFKRVAVSIAKFVLRPLPIRWLTKRLDHLARRYNGQTSDSCVVIGGAYGYSRETLKTKWFDNAETIAFEGVKFPCFGEYEVYLHHMYGDYMQPPPPDERRNRHEIVQLEVK